MVSSTSACMAPAAAARPRSWLSSWESSKSCARACRRWNIWKPYREGSTILSERSDRKHRPPDVLVFESLRIHRRQSRRVHFNDRAGNRRIRRLVGNRRLHDKNPLPLWLDPEARELTEAERGIPLRGQHQKITA